MSQQATTLANLREQPKSVSDLSVSLNTVGGFEALQRIAKLFAASDVIPTQFKGNIPSCVIAVDMAMRLGANPLSVMQSLYVVHGRPAWSAQFLIATMNQCGRFSAIRYEFQGKEESDEWGCRAVAIELSTGEKLVGPLITIALAKKEGWYGKNGSKWQSMPELMLRYRAASWFVRAYAPEIAMGLQTVEEVKDTYDMELAPGGGYQLAMDDIRRNESPEVEAETEPAPHATAEPSPAESPVVECPNTGEMVSRTGECQTCKKRETDCPHWRTVQ